MNYRHQFHAGNFADVCKHVVLVQLIRAMQRKEKGFLYLDTHAGRGRYDLAAASRGNSLERQPEHPAGIGRLWSRRDLLPPINDYLECVRAFDRAGGNEGAEIRFYPGSPWLAKAVARLQDRLALCEWQHEECLALQNEFVHERKVSVHELDGYCSVEAMLPPLEKRALTLIDPPFEDKGEYGAIVDTVEKALRRLPGGTLAIWYPLTERARVDAFFDELQTVALPPTWAAELAIAGDGAGIKMRGCGLVVINPPWQLDRLVKPVLESLAELLAQAPGGYGRVDWLVAEK